MNSDYLANRVTIRKFSPESITDEKLSEIVSLAMRAPTCGNMQLYSVIVTRDKNAKEAMAKLHFNQPASVGCDVILTVCADFNIFTRWCKLSNAKPGYDNFHSFIMAFTDAVIFAQQIVTVAESKGLGTCYLGTVNYTAKEISELLHLPERVVPVAAIALGYPAEHPSQSDRLPLEAIMHIERYREDSDEKIKEFFSYKENLPENIKFVEENNKDTLAQVFTDVRYTKEMNEGVSETFRQLVEKKGFPIS